MDETGHKCKRCFLILYLFLAFIKQPPLHSEFNIVAIKNLTRFLGNTTFFYRVHVVIPFANPLVSGFPIRGSCKVLEINIGFFTILKPMHLFGCYKMHFAQETGFIHK